MNQARKVFEAVKDEHSIEELTKHVVLMWRSLHDRRFPDHHFWRVQRGDYRWMPDGGVLRRDYLPIICARSSTRRRDTHGAGAGGSDRGGDGISCSISRSKPISSPASSAGSISRTSSSAAKLERLMRRRIRRPPAHAAGSRRRRVRPSSARHGQSASGRVTGSAIRYLDLSPPSVHAPRALEQVPASSRQLSITFQSHRLPSASSMAGPDVIPPWRRTRTSAANFQAW